jgi:hypothetical protein
MSGSEKDTVGREFTSRLAALLQDDYLQNICEVTQDPSEVEETFHFLPITGNLFDAANKFTTTTTTTDRVSNELVFHGDMCRVFGRKYFQRERSKQS